MFDYTAKQIVHVLRRPAARATGDPEKLAPLKALLLVNSYTDD
jgi:hypothetical protein